MSGGLFDDPWFDVSDSLPPPARGYKKENHRSEWFIGRKIVLPTVYTGHYFTDAAAHIWFINRYAKVRFLDSTRRTSANHH